jgi:tetratricopeptide (TPR) repeat protein
MTNEFPITNEPHHDGCGRWSIGLGHSLVSLIWLLGFPHAVRADSIFVGTLERPNVTIKEIRGDQLVFEINDRPAEPVPVTRVTKLLVTSDPTFTAAEEAYAGGKFDVAVDGYQKSLRGAGAGKPWIRDWSAMRLIDAANRTGRFDAASTAYITLLLKDPTAAVARFKPALPDAKSTYLDTAVAEVNKALQTSKITDPQKQALLTFLVELHRARKDAKAADEAVEQLLKIPGASAASDPDTKRAVADMKLSLARVAIDAKDYAKAIATIESARALFADPQQQADALYCLADARFGAAMQSKDAQALKDAGLAYMRVVANFKDAPGRPHVADALLKTAQVHEQLGEPKTAEQLYEQVAREFNSEPAIATAARDNLSRLRARGQRSSATGNTNNQ